MLDHYSLRCPSGKPGHIAIVKRSSSIARI
jgi:hypothetical protein